MLIPAIGVTYEVYISDPFGTRLGDASNFTSLSYVRTVNDVGSLTLVLPDNFNASLLAIPDGRIEVWRRLPNGRTYLDTDTVWLIKTLGYDRDDAGNVTMTVGADTALSMLREPGRVVNYYAGSSQADKAGFADNMIKAIVRENAGSLATTASRSLAAWLTIEPDRSLGVAVSKAFAWREVLKVIQEIAAASTQAGIYVAFDIVSPTLDSLEFRTYTQQRGVDHRLSSGQPVVLSSAFGNLGSGSLLLDYRNEVTYAKVLGRDQGAARLTGEAQDLIQIGASPFGLREMVVSSNTTSEIADLTNEAQAAVRSGRARSIYQAQIAPTADTQYGIHWGWGDYVTIQDFGVQLDCRIEAVTVTVASGEEVIEAVVRSDT